MGDCGRLSFKNTEVALQNAEVWLGYCGMRADKEMGYNQMDETTPAALLGQKPGAKASTPRINGGFIKVPLDLQWIQAACLAKAAEMALYLQYMQGMLGPNAMIQIRPSQCLKFGLKASSRRGQLERLEARGLVKLDRGVGRCDRVMILGCHTGWFGGSPKTLSTTTSNRG